MLTLLRQAGMGLLALIFSAVGSANVSILQRGYTPDNAGANLNETQLTPANVSAYGFGKLFSLPVDGAIYAQPLYASNLNINGGVHNVVFVATMKDKVYAFDADQPADPLWQVDYSQPVTGATAAPVSYYHGTNSGIARWIGIEGTPVIDLGSNSLFFVANTLENNASVYRLYAVDLSTGANKPNSPRIINASVSTPGGVINFNSALQNQRMSLVLSRGQVIVAFSGNENVGTNYYGWTLSYNAVTLTQTGVFNPAPANTGGGVWQSGRAPVVDAQGYVYLFTGNAFPVSARPTADGAANFAESAVKLEPVTLQVVDYFTPANYQALDAGDLDFSSSGPLLAPNGNALLGGGKTGTLYVLNTQNLGQMQANDAGALQSLNFSAGQIMAGPVLWNRSAAAGNPLIFNWSDADPLYAYAFDPVANSVAATPLASFNPNQSYVHPGGMLALSANGDQNGILWAVINSQGNDDIGVTPGELHAFNAANISQELWNSTQLALRDDMGLLNKYTPPVVASGKVYVATQSNQLLVYGLLPAGDAVTANAWPPLKNALGGMANFQVAAYAANGTEVAANWSADGLPASASGRFYVDSHNRTQFQVLLASGAAEGLYRLTLTAITPGGTILKQPVLLNVVNTALAQVSSVQADSDTPATPASAAVDGNIGSFWETAAGAAYPHRFLIDLGSIQPVAGLDYIPRQDGCADGVLSQYQIEFSTDQTNFKTLASDSAFDYSGAWRGFACDGHSYPSGQKVAFPTVNARYLNLILFSATADGGSLASAAEFKTYIATSNFASVSLSLNNAGITLGQPVTLTASVTGDNATGAVQFLIDNDNLEDPVALNNGGAALTSYAINTQGPHVISASYLGDANNNASLSNGVTINVAGPDTVSIGPAAETLTPGSPLTLTATVSGYNPGGSIQFYSNGAALDNPVPVVDGVATLVTTDLTLGTDIITANYSGDTYNAANNSATPVIETVATPTQIVPAAPGFAQCVLAVGLGLISWLGLRRKPWMLA